MQNQKLEVEREVYMIEERKKKIAGTITLNREMGCHPVDNGEAGFR